MNDDGGTSAAPEGSFRVEFRSLARLALPLAVLYVGNQLMGAVDAAIVGRLGEVPLSAVGLGSGIFFSIVVLGMGLILGLDPLVSQAVGGGEHQKAHHYFQQSMVLAGAVSIPVVGASALAMVFLEPLGIDPAVAQETRGYVWGRLPGVPAFLILLAGRSYLQSYDRTRALVVGMVVANIVNVPFSWALVFGDAGLTKFGLPPLGIPQLSAAGAGIMSSVSAFIQLAITLLAARALATEQASRARSSFRLDFVAIRQMARLGLPIGLTFFAEVASFGIVSVLIGVLGSLPLAAHTVALTLISTTFQVPMAIGAATSVRVGQAIGRGDTKGTRRAGLAGFMAGGGFMVLTAGFLLVAPAVAASLFTDKPSVVEAAVPLLFAAALFQLVDGVQAVGAGALRGAGDTKFPFLANLIGHYGLGLPVGAVLASAYGFGALGYWWGLALGLAAVAVFLLVRFVRISAQPIAPS